MLKHTVTLLTDQNKLTEYLEHFYRSQYRICVASVSFQEGREVHKYIFSMKCPQTFSHLVNMKVENVLWVHQQRAARAQEWLTASNRAAVKRLNHRTAGAEFVSRVVKTDTKDLHPAWGGPDEFSLLFLFTGKRQFSFWLIINTSMAQSETFGSSLFITVDVNWQNRGTHRNHKRSKRIKRERLGAGLCCDVWIHKELTSDQPQSPSPRREHLNPVSWDQDWILNNLKGLLVL